MQPAHEDVGPRLAREGEAGHGHVGDLVLQVVLAAGGGPLRHRAHEEQDHRDVVGSEAPEDVLLLAHLPQVQAVRVDVVDVAQLAGVHELLRASGPRGGTRGCGRPSAPASCARASSTSSSASRHRAGPAASPRRRPCPPASACLRQLVVLRGGGGDRHRLDLGVVQQVLEVARGAHALVGRLHLLAGPSRSGRTPRRGGPSGRGCGPGCGPSTRSRPGRRRPSPPNTYLSPLLCSMSIHMAKKSICMPMIRQKASKMTVLGESAPVVSAVVEDPDAQEPARRR